MERARRFALPCVLAGLVALGTFAVGTVVSNAAGRPTAKVSPRTGLADYTNDGQYVTITWSNFPKGSDVYMRECVRGAKRIDGQCSRGGLGSSSSCGPSCPGTPFLGPSDRNGAGQGSARLAIGGINLEDDLSPIPGQSFSCSYKKSERCSVFVLWDVNDLKSGVEVPIEFARPVETCPPGGTDLPGAGGGLGQRMFLGLAAEVCDKPDNIGLSYTTLFSGSDAISGSGGLLDTLKTGYDTAAPTYYAVTPRGMTAAETKTVETWKGKMAYAPVTASGLVLAYRIYDPFTGEQIRDLVLTPEQIAKIFSKQLTSWTDPTIAKLNPRHHFPIQVTPYMRGDACDETYQLTSWFFTDAAARRAWIDGGKVLKDNPFERPSDIIPALSSGYALVTGARAESSALALDRIDTRSVGVIGYMDSSWAALYNLPTVRIRLANGDTVEASNRTISQGVSSMRVDDAGLLRPNPAAQDASHWPMPTVGYAVVPWDAAGAVAKPSPKIQTAIQRLLRFVATTAQQNVPAGYVPLSDALLAQTKAVADGIKEGVTIPPVDGGDGAGGDLGGGSNGTSSTSSFGSSTGTESGSASTDGQAGDGSSGGDEPSPVVSTEIIVQPTAPPPALSLSAARLLLPGVGGLGLLLTVGGLCLIFADRLGAIVLRRGRRKAKTTS